MDDPLLDYGFLMDDLVSGPELEVRAARLADGDSVGDCHAEAWRVAYADLFPAEFLERAAEDRRERTGSELAAMLVAENEPTLSDGSILLVVEADAAVVGFAHCGCEPVPRQQEIYAFYVHPRSWGTGAAQAMWDETVERLSTRSTAPIVLWTLAGAARARRFYERNGWMLTGCTELRDFGDGNQSHLVQYRSA